MKKWSEFLEGRCWPGYKPKPGKKAYSPGSCVKEDLRQWFDPDHPKGGWKRINSKGEAIGPCAREPGEAKPKCMSNEKRGSLSKKERASAVSAKRRHDPNPERKGQPINVSNFGKGKISENMENLDEKNVPTSPEKWAQAKSQAKAKFDVYPSAYANGWASKKYKEMGGGWKSVSEESEVVDEAAKGTLHRVRYSHDDSSGNGIASGNLSLHAPDKESASRYAESDLKKRGKKNIKIHAVTPQKSSIKEAKEKTEYDYEGDMARGQLQSVINNAQRVHDMLEDNDNLPEWVQSKITLAEDYISTVANYMMSEVDEEVVVEASYKDTRGTLKDRLAGEVLNFHSMHDRIPSTSEFGRSVKSKPKQQAISHAKKLLGVQVKKEEVMQEGIKDEPHEIVHKDTGKTVSTHKNFEAAYSAYQNLVKASDHAIGHIPKKTNEAVSHEPWKDKHFGPTKVIQQKYKVKTDTKTYNVKAETESHAHKLVSNHAPGSKIVSIEHKGRIMEEVKPITELSADTLDRYKEKAKKSSDSLTGQGKYRQANDRTMNVMKATGKQMDKTVANIRKALNRESVVKLEEGRPSQRHPLEGHEYHKKSNDALVHIAKDAHAAAEAMKSHNTTAENKYRDQASDSATVRYFRQKNGMPEWYKKKYGHVKEGVVNEVMDEPNYSLSIQARQKKAQVAKTNDAGTPAQLSLKATPKKLETPVYESRQMQIVREALADAKKKDAAKKKEKKVNPGGDDKFQADPELTSSITKNAQ